MFAGKLYQSTLGFNGLAGGTGTGMAGANGGGTFSRPRSSSMSMIDRSEAAWAILGSTGGYRSKSKLLHFFLYFLLCVPNTHPLE